MVLNDFYFLTIVLCNSYNTTYIFIKNMIILSYYVRHKKHKNNYLFFSNTNGLFNSRM